MCDEAEEGDVLLLCDSCDSAFHLQCAKPRLRRIPAGEPSASRRSSCLQPSSSHTASMVHSRLVLGHVTNLSH